MSAEQLDEEGRGLLRQIVEAQGYRPANACDEFPESARRGGIDKCLIGVQVVKIPTLAAPASNPGDHADPDAVPKVEGLH